MSTTPSTAAAAIAKECVGYRVRMLNRIVSRLYDDALRPHGIRFSQLNILTVVSLRQPVRPTDVGRILSIEKSTLSRNLRLMEENGWLRSEPAESGGGHLLRITRSGERLYRAAAPAWREAQDEAVRLLGGAGTKAIREATDRARDSGASS